MPDPAAYDGYLQSWGSTYDGYLLPHGVFSPGGTVFLDVVGGATTEGVSGGHFALIFPPLEGGAVGIAGAGGPVSRVRQVTGGAISVAGAGAREGRSQDVAGGAATTARGGGRSIAEGRLFGGATSSTHGGANVKQPRPAPQLAASTQAGQSIGRFGGLRSMPTVKVGITVGTPTRRMDRVGMRGRLTTHPSTTTGVKR